jgi:hypothetical protein
MQAERHPLLMEKIIGSHEAAVPRLIECPESGGRQSVAFCCRGTRFGDARARVARRILGSHFRAAMSETQIFRHQNYELACSAQVNDRGKFEPALVISKHTWPSRPRIIAVQRGSYPTADVAIESARAQGIEWVMNYG